VRQTDHDLCHIWSGEQASGFFGRGSRLVGEASGSGVTVGVLGQRSCQCRFRPSASASYSTRDASSGTYSPP
jgi:hypothetical protein